MVRPRRFSFATVAAAALAAIMMWAYQPPEDALEEGFQNPPAAAKPHIYYMILNGYVDRAHMEKEIAEYAAAGIGGLCVFDVGARGDKAGQPPAGPEFLSPAWLGDFNHLLKSARKHEMDVDLSVASSWDMGGSWVKPEDASMTLVHSSMEIMGGSRVDAALPFPDFPAETPKGTDGRPAFAKDVAVLAIPSPEKVDGYQFDFELKPPRPRLVNRVVLYQNDAPAEGDTAHFANEFRVSVSNTQSNAAAYREIARGKLEPRGGPQEFRFPETEAKYVRLHILGSGRVELAEFQVLSTSGENVNLSHRALRLSDASSLLRFTSARGQLGAWAADNIHDGILSGARGSWSSGDGGALLVKDSKAVVNITSQVDAKGRLRWNAPSGKWLILRYVAVNTGEKLKVPSPNSDGLATDHFNADVTRRYIGEVIRRLKSGIPDLEKSGLKDLYLASYEVRGQVWTPGFLSEFQKRRGYDLTPYLPILSGGQVDSEETTERVWFDYRKTQGELLVDAYYRAAVETAHRAGFTVESEAGGPGPPIHQVPVDALLANGAVDSVRGEFWPDRMQNSAIWVVKETASAAHIYGKRRVHMEAFTTSNHWMEGPADLKLSADRAFTEGMNHVVWHTSAHQPPLAGKPGWVYYAGTHLNQNLPWWPMAKAYLTYLARASFLLQQGLPVSDVLAYYGDQGYNFVLPKRTDSALGFGYEYDVTNADVLLRRVSVKDGRLVLPDGVRYELLTLPEREDIDLDVLRRIEQLVREGATVVGKRPARSSGYGGYPQRDREVEKLARQVWGDCDGATKKESTYGKGHVVCGLTPREALAKRGVGPDLRFEGGSSDVSLDFIHRTTGDAEIYFVRNKKNQPEEVRAEFRVKGKQPELWDAATGERIVVQQFEDTGRGTRFALRLEPEGSTFVVFRRAGQPAAARDVQRETAAIDVKGPWKVRFSDGPAAPAAVVMDTLRSWTSSHDEKTKYFSGVAEYEAEVDIPASWIGQDREVTLDLGDLWAVADVKWNGQDLGVVWRRPFRVQATSVARPGKNHLSVRVANNWVNRLVGDALGSGPKVTKTNVTVTGAVNGRVWRDVSLRDSGLLGPVKLEARW